MNNPLAIVVLVSGIAYGTPLLIAGLGELLAERSGVLNLGIEGMMLVGAAVAFWISQTMGGPAWLALTCAALGAMAASAVTAGIFALVCIGFRANQIIAGLALTIFGGSVGLSSYLASIGHLSGEAAHHQMNAIDILGWKGVPILGPVLFDQDILVYLSWVLVVLIWWYVYRSRYGLNLRAVGEQPEAADAMGVNVTAYRVTHTVIGGALAGLAGAYYTLALTPSWSDGLTAGAGWIALGLVIVAFWRPGRLVVGAYLFGMLTSLGFTLASRGTSIPPEVFGSLPYLMTIVVLVLGSSIWRRGSFGSPMALGTYYEREEH